MPQRMNGSKASNIKIGNLGVLHLGNVAIVAEDALRIGHHGLQLILKAESFFEIHIAHSLFLSLIS